MSAGLSLVSAVVLPSIDGQDAVAALRTSLVSTLLGAFIALMVVGLGISCSSPRAGMH